MRAQCGRRRDGQHVDSSAEMEEKRAARSPDVDGILLRLVAAGELRLDSVCLLGIL